MTRNQARFIIYGTLVAIGISAIASHIAVTILGGAL